MAMHTGFLVPGKFRIHYPMNTAAGLGGNTTAGGSDWEDVTEGGVPVNVNRDASGKISLPGITFQ